MRTRTIIFFLAAIAFLASVAGGYLYYRVSRNALLKEGHGKAELQAKMVADHIGGHLSEYQKGVGTLAGMTDLRQALTRKDSESISSVNSILDTFYKGLGVSVCYLMDADGNTLAASNRNTPKSFVGKNYAFRPYFRQALQGVPTIHMALGVTSGKQGVYYSHPVYGSDKTLPLGVVVIKASTKALKHEIDHDWEGIMLLTDPNGVIFLSSRQDWMYKVLWKVSAQTISKIARTRQFGQGPFKWVGLKRKNEHMATDLSGKEFHLHQSNFNNYKGWQVVFLHDHNAVLYRVGQPLFRTMGAVIITALLFIGLVLFVLYRNASQGIRKQAKAEASLIQSERKYRGLVQSIPGMVYRGNPDWTAEIVSNRRVISGYSQGELNLPETQWIKIVHPGDREKVLAESSQIEKKPATLVQEYRITDKKKGIRWIRDYKTSQFSTEGSFRGVEGVAFDITDEKGIEEALKKSEERFRLLFDEAPGMYVITRIQKGIATIADANKSFMETLGYTLQEIIGKPLLNYYTPHSQREVIETDGFNRALAGSLDSEERELVTRDGRIIQTMLKAFPEKDKDGVVVGTRALYIDISQRKQIEEKLRASELKLRTLFENSKDAIVITEKGGKITDANQSAFELLGYSKDEFERLNFGEIYADPREGKRFLNAIGQRGSVKDLEVKLCRKDGTQIVCFMTVSSQYAETGAIVSYQGMIRDITAQRQAEADREKLISDLTKALAEVKTLSGLLPVCANCKKIRDDGGYWNRIETYIENRSEAQFSHSICPECEKELYPELFEEDELQP